MPKAFWSVKTNGCEEVFTMSITPKLSFKVHCAVMTVGPMVNFTIVFPVRLEKKGTINLTNLLLPGLRVKFSMGNMGMALFMILNSECLLLCSASNSCMFFIPNTMSIESSILATSV